jgi:hypothetical protein
MLQCSGKDNPMAVGTVLTTEGDILPPKNDYRAIVGSLLYLSCQTRPDISFAVGCLSRHMNSPTQQHMKAARHVLLYLSTPAEWGMFFHYFSLDHFKWWPTFVEWEASMKAHSKLLDEGAQTPPIPFGLPVEVHGDADFAGHVDTRRSTSGMIVTWHGHSISWLSKLRSIVTTSTTEAEFVASATAAKEGLWLRKFLSKPLPGAMNLSFSVTTVPLSA